MRNQAPRQARHTRRRVEVEYAEGNGSTTQWSVGPIKPGPYVRVNKRKGLLTVMWYEEGVKKWRNFRLDRVLTWRINDS